MWSSLCLYYCTIRHESLKEKPKHLLNVSKILDPIEIQKVCFIAKNAILSSGINGALASDALYVPQRQYLSSLIHACAIQPESKIHFPFIISIDILISFSHGS